MIKNLSEKEAMRISEFEFHAASSAATEAAGAKLAAFLEPGDVLCLKGALGFGKTTFAKGVVRALQGSDTIFLGSPTYTLIQEYRKKNPPLFHFDFYRVKVAEELWQIGWEEYCGGEGICLVEWADLFPELLPKNALWLEFTARGQGRLRKA